VIEKIPEANVSIFESHSIGVVNYDRPNSSKFAESVLPIGLANVGTWKDCNWRHGRKSVTAQHETIRKLVESPNIESETQ